MFFIAAFLVAGSSYSIVNRLAVPLMVTTPIAFILMVFLWIDDHTGINHLLNSSWQSLSGVNSGSGVVQNCGGADIFTTLFVLVLAIINVIPGVCAIVGIPLGILVTGGGAAYGLWSKDSQPFKWGLLMLTVGFASIVVAGVILRTIHGMSGSSCG